MINEEKFINNTTSLSELQESISEMRKRYQNANGQLKQTNVEEEKRNRKESYVPLPETCKTCKKLKKILTKMCKNCMIGDVTYEEHFN